ncbi:hypothetical protein [Apibacter sp. HY039]|uniref:hypothetical protein n=1 Tax=Apibacter sp. HY039 TaxID=2501476 RepID=UPI000FEB64B3|nr:hypothetical protein [Apibacter sp. HY039]
MSKKILFWIFLIIGIGWITGVSYWYLRIENLDLTSIRWDENFNSTDANTRAFFKALLLVILPLLVTALLFYFIGLFFGKKAEEILMKVEEENETLKNELAQHINKIETMKVLYTGGKIERKPRTIKESETSQHVAQEKFIRNEQVVRDDLKIIEGVGERIEFFLNESGIYTWKQLSEAKEEDLRNVLTLYGGASYKIHDPSSWPEQALLAYEKRWDDFNALKEKVRKK